MCELQISLKTEFRSEPGFEWGIGRVTATIPMLQRAIDAMPVPGISIEHRVISDGDELALLPDEFGAFATSVIKVQRASGAARIVARVCGCE